MAQRFEALRESHKEFIGEQRIFFVATAASDGRVNVSPKGYECLKVIDSETVAWMNLTGSGNETAAHVLQRNRMTLMWCSFAGPPLILRVYGRAQIVHAGDNAWDECADAIPSEIGSRQYFILDIDLVQTSCGSGVPCFEYVQERSKLRDWSMKLGPDGITQYWARENDVSVDGYPTDFAD